jgi:tetratricopeptide (TPR) repeat protein
VAFDRDKILEAAQKLVAKGRFDKAIIEYQKLVAHDPADARTLLRIGDLHLKTQQFAEAIAVYERVGQQYAQAGFALKAIAVYKNVREIIQKHVPHLEDRFGYIVPQLAELYSQLGLTSDALAAFDEMATRLQRLGRDRDAIDVFRKVVALDPENPLPHLRLAEAFVRVKELDRAADSFGTAGEILLRMGRHDDALRVFERLLLQQPTPRFARLAAEIYLSRQTANDAMAALQKLQICVKEDPRDLDTLELLARAFDVLGQPAKAVEVHKEAGRIAKEGGNKERLSAIVSVLSARAPHDDGVKQLAAQLRVLERGGAPSIAPGGGSQSAYPASTAAPSIGPISVAEEVDLDELEDLESSELESVSMEGEQLVPESEEPIPLRSSRPPSAADPEREAHDVLLRAEQLRQQGMHDRAIDELRAVIQRLPSARPLREKLTDLLIENGDQESAVLEMLHYAGWLANTNDPEGAARLLDEVLLFDAQNPTALEMLRMLGYALPDGSDAAEQAPDYEAPSRAAHDLFAPPSFAAPSAYDPYAPRGTYGTLPGPQLEEYEPPTNQGVLMGTAPPAAPDAAAAEYGAQDYGDAIGFDDPSSYDPDAPLPSYDLEEVGAEQALSRHYTGSHPSMPASTFAPASVRAPEPSQPPQRPSIQRGLDAAPLVELDDPFGPLPSFPIDDGRVAVVEAPPLSASQAIAASGRSAIDEDALEEIDFFAQHGMFEEARNLLAEQLSRSPNHPLLVERQRELMELVHQAPATAPPPSSLIDDRSFDIAASLGALDELEMPAPVKKPAGPAPGEQVSVETVFEAFKQGVAAQVPESDASTHYDLGVAYKEMGLINDAINEFQVAARDPARECVCLSMIGMIQLEQGNVEEALNAFIGGLHAFQKTPEQELALTYEVANAYEMRGNPDQALHFFERVARTEPGYQDMRGSVAERIARLQPAPKQPSIARASNAESLGDEFDKAFDDLFGKS